MSAVGNACTIVIPVYNEAGSVADVVDGIVREMEARGHEHDVLVLNDGSTDWTPELERRLRSLGRVAVHGSPVNLGKGAMLDRAFPMLSGEFALVIDADGEYLARDVPAVLAPLLRDEADFVLGSRYGFGRPRPRQYLATYAVNRVLGLAFRLLSGVRLRDMLSGVYAFRSARVRGLRLRERRFSYTPELLWRLMRARPPLRLREVPVDYRFRGYAAGKKIRWWETATILFAILRYRFAKAHGAGR